MKPGTALFLTLSPKPRRISAISLAQRVSQELGERPGACGTRGSLVGYAIRLESKTSETSRLVYATTVCDTPSLFECASLHKI